MIIKINDLCKKMKNKLRDTVSCSLTLIFSFSEGKIFFGEGGRKIFNKKLKKNRKYLLIK